MAQQKLLSNMFSPLSKEDMEERIEQEFATLNANLELEQSIKKEVYK